MSAPAHVFLFFCDAAATRSDGKLDAHGIFNELYATAFPARQDPLTIGGVIEWRHSTDGRQTFRVHLDDPDGHAIYTVDGHTDVEARDASRPAARTHLSLPLRNVVFAAPGRYRLRLLTGGEEWSGPSLYLIESADL